MFGQFRGILPRVLPRCGTFGRGTFAHSPIRIKTKIINNYIIIYKNLTWRVIYAGDHLYIVANLSFISDFPEWIVLCTAVTSPPPHWTHIGSSLHSVTARCLFRGQSPVITLVLIFIPWRPTDNNCLVNHAYIVSCESVNVCYWNDRMHVLYVTRPKALRLGGVCNYVQNALGLGM